jgi:thiamine pyrophosphokinase
MKIIVAAGGEWDIPWATAFLAKQNPDYLIAADGGAAGLLACGQKPDLIIGDLDSTSAEMLATLGRLGTEIKRYPAEKDETDLELALLYADEFLQARGEAEGEILLIGAGGGRLDHLLSNIAVLLGLAKRGRRVFMHNPRDFSWVLGPGSQQLVGWRHQTISLLPLTEHAVVTYAGLRYSLERFRLGNYRSRSISNIVDADEVEIIVHEGWLLVVRPY